MKLLENPSGAGVSWGILLGALVLGAVIGWLWTRSGMRVGGIPGKTNIMVENHGSNGGYLG